MDIQSVRNFEKSVIYGNRYSRFELDAMIGSVHIHGTYEGIKGRYDLFNGIRYKPLVCLKSNGTEFCIFNISRVVKHLSESRIVWYELFTEDDSLQWCRLKCY